MEEKRIIFLRDDDLYAPDGKFRKVFAFCAGEDIPVTYAVVPGLLQDSLVRFLKGRSGKQGLFNVVQHGWTHENRNPEPGWPMYEFGPARTFAEQEKDIAGGFKIMKGKFGKMFCRGFVPPFHFYDRNTFKAAGKTGFKIFAAGGPRFSSAGNLFQFPLARGEAGRSEGREWGEGKRLYLAAQVGFNRYSRRYKSLPVRLSEVVRKTSSCLRTSAVTGIYFHHSTLDNDNFDKFKGYCRFLKNLESSGLVKLVLFSYFLPRAAANKKF